MARDLSSGRLSGPKNKVRPSIRKLIFIEYGAVFQRWREKFQ